MSIVLGPRSIARLQDVHPDLVRVVRRAAALSSLDFTVLEGMRTLPRQKQLLAQGATRTLNSRHLTGHAVDLAPMIGGTVSWDWPLYDRLAKVVKAAADHEDVPITWGGDWESFKDGPHWELPWKQYPKGD
jgi:peptidoglycan L-alanyl-D-glutamate endopeptidase CwlK